ncbi:MAG TPA: aromatic amino acid ammonia-lyase [Bordetella sp.]|nr:aromatic amino acid ammonia-lyase [Bordetella sp.]
MHSFPDRRRSGACLMFAVLCIAAPWSARAQEPVVLDGAHLTYRQVAQIARAGAPVQIDPQARARVARAHDIVLAAAAADMPIYGLNRGVGSARQVAVLEGQRENASEVRKSSEAFNRNLLISHSRATGPATDAARVRAAMAVRLNTALTGSSGMQPVIADMYAALLNAGITPAVPRDASVGEADIFLLAYTGLAMMGVGDVIVDGQRQPAARALRDAGIEPVRPFAKDALAIMSSNAYSAGHAALVANDLEHLLRRADLVFLASLEALNGNVAPLLAGSVAVRPFKGHREAAADMSDLLQGSYLWKKDPARFSQDPLSFRTTAQLHGALREQLQALAGHLSIQLNASDDNPTVLVDVRAPDNAPEQEARYYVSGTVDGRPVQGAVIPTAHFEPVSWVLDAQAMAIGLSHLTNQSMQRANRLATKDFTGIDLLEGQPPGSLAGFWKTANVIQTRVFADTLPVSSLVQPSAKDIEDVGTQAPLAIERLDRIVDHAYRMLGLELAVAAEVIDRRLQAQPQLALAAPTGELLAHARLAMKQSQPRLPGGDIDAAYMLVRCTGDPAAKAAICGPAASP